MDHQEYQTILYSREGLDSRKEHVIVGLTLRLCLSVVNKLILQEVVNRPSLTANLAQNRTRWWLDIDYVVLTADP